MHGDFGTSTGGSRPQAGMRFVLEPSMFTATCSRLRTTPSLEQGNLLGRQWADNPQGSDSVMPSVMCSSSK